MKKSLLFTALIVAGISITSFKQVANKAEVVPAKVKSEQRAVKPLSKAEAIIEIDATETVTLASLEENFENLEVKELQAELEKVDQSRKKLQLIEAFNTRKLTIDEERELAKFINTRVVLTKLVMEKKFEELEQL